MSPVAPEIGWLLTNESGQRSWLVPRFIQALNTQAIISLAHRDPNLVARFKALHQSRVGEWESHRHARHAQRLEGAMGECDFFIVDLNDLPIRFMKAGGCCAGW